MAEERAAAPKPEPLDCPYVSGDRRGCDQGSVCYCAENRRTVEGRRGGLPLEYDDFIDACLESDVAAATERE